MMQTKLNKRNEINKKYPVYMLDLVHKYLDVPLTFVDKVETFFVMS